MDTRRLGTSDLDLSVIGLGSWLTFGVGIEREQAIACVHRVLDLGITFLDTANGYGRGAAEELLGEALAGIDRSSYVLATKLFFPMGPDDKGLSAAQVARQCDASLRRLRTDHLDLYQCHRYDPDTPLDETMEALTHLVDAGKVRWLGFSEWTAPQIEASFEIPGVRPFVSSQPEYSILCRRPVPTVFPACRTHDVGQVVWSPLAQGVLTGKYRPGAPLPPDSRAADDRMGGFLGRYLRDDVLQAVDRLRPIAADLGLSMAQLALAWVLQEPLVSSAIIGASRPEQIEDNIGAVGVRLDAATMAAIDEAVAPVVVDR